MTALAVLIGLAWVIGSFIDEPNRKPTDSDYVPPFVDPGHLAYLHDDTDAFRGKDALSEGAKVLAARDDIGFRQMVNKGRAIVVPKNTTVKILDYDQSTGYDFREVRVQDGIFAGEAVWVSRLMLRPK